MKKFLYFFQERVDRKGHMTILGCAFGHIENLLCSTVIISPAQIEIRGSRAHHQLEQFLNSVSRL